MYTRPLLLVFLLVTISTLSAVWSDNPSQNNAIADQTNEETIPKIAVCNDLTTYICWFSLENNNYNVRLQHLDAEGNELWQHEGILISNHPSMSWLTDYDISTDGLGNAIIVFQDIRSVTNNIFAYKVSPTGDMLWDTDGLTLSEDSNSEYSNMTPTLTVTPDNEVVVAWQRVTTTSVVQMQRISASGQFLWGSAGITIASLSNRITWPQLLPASDSSVLVKYYEDSGPIYSPTRSIKAVRINANGSYQWANAAVISSAGGISAWTQLLSMVSDHNNGFFLAWHDDRDNDNIEHPYIQHVLADGSIPWTSNGIIMTTRNNAQQYTPKLAFDYLSNNIYSFWHETDLDQNTHGIVSQKLSLEGNVLWAPVGLTVYAPISDGYIPLYANMIGNNPMVVYEQYIGATDQNILLGAKALTPEGASYWINDLVISNTALAKYHFSFVPSSSSFYLAWHGQNSSIDDIFAARFNMDGTLGNPSLPLLPPTNLSATIINSHNIYLEWLAPPINCIMHFYVYRDGTRLNEIAFDSTCYLDENITVGTHTYYATTLYNWGESAPSNVVTMNILAEEDPTSSLSTLSIKNYPNPFNPSTSIQYSIPKSGNVAITIYNAKGQLVKQLLKESKKEGNYTILWDGKNQAGQIMNSGIYYCQVKMKSESSTTRLVLMK